MSHHFLGVLFNIDELGGAYGLAAYKLLFETVSPTYFHGCHFTDGDLGEGFCIGIESSLSDNLFKIEALVGKSPLRGFASADARLTFDPRVTSYLAPSGYISHQGTLEGIENPWMESAWKAGQARTSPQALVTVSDTLSPSTLIDSQPARLALEDSQDTSDEYGVGEVIGHEYVVRDVHKGGMGIVYIVEDLQSREQNIQLRLALKTFQSRYLWNEEAIRRFEREALVWIQLGKHPNIVHAMLVQRVANRPYLWLEFVPGRSLADDLKRRTPATDQALSYALQFCSGMRHAHEKHGIIHRDIKPANILLDRDDVLKITDFGLSKLQAELTGEVVARAGGRLSADEMETVSGIFITAAGQCMGTPAYIPPEAISAPQSVDVRADVYSFGIVLYEMLTGGRPFRGANLLQQHLDALPPSVRSVNPDISLALDRLVARCLEKEPEARFQNFADLESALRQLCDDLPLELSHKEKIVISPRDHWFMKGFSLMELGKNEDAIECFREVIALDASQHEAHNNVGACLARLGRLQEAIDFTAKAVALKPDYAEAWSNLGGMYAGQQRYEEGIQACHRAIELKPRWSEAYSNLGCNLAGTGRLEEAASSFYRAIAEDDAYWLAYLKLAQLYLERGSPEEAINLLRSALQENPREPDLLASLAACLFEMNRNDEAAKYLQLALQVDSEHPLALRVGQQLSSSR